MKNIKHTYGSSFIQCSSLCEYWVLASPIGSMF